MRGGTQKNRVPATSLTIVRPSPVAMAGQSGLVKYIMIRPATRGGELLDAKPPRRSGFELTQFGVDGTVGASGVAAEAANPVHLLGTLQARAQNAFRYRS